MVNPSSKQHAPALAVLNLKGGVGKTHAVWLLASVCQERREKILVVDLDPQGNISNSFHSSDSATGPGVEALFHPGSEVDVRTSIQKTAYSHVDLIPANASLARFDVSDPIGWEKSDGHFNLGEALRSVESEYDWIVLDCPPRLSLVSVAALCASDGVIVPLEAADWGAQGIVQVAELIRVVQKQYNPRLRLLGYLVSRFKKARAYQQSYLTQLRHHFGNLVFDVKIADIAKFEQSVTDRIPITLHSRRSLASDIARRFFDEVQARLQSVEGSGFSSRRTNVSDGRDAGARKP